MRKASFSVEKVSLNTDAHNSREQSPKYLIGCEKGKENEYIKYYEYNNFQELAEARYLEVNKQKMQTSQKEALFEEALISLEEHHTKDDVLELFKSLNKKYTGHTLINLAIHNDEGHFLKDGIEYYPTKHIIQKEDSWYILDENDTHILEALKDKDFKPKEEDFKIKVNIKDFEKVYNYHAHAVFSRFDLVTGKSARFQKGTMSERYKFVAEQMQMKYAPDENRFVKKSIGQYKADLSATRNAKLVMQKELELKHTKELQATKEQLKEANNQLRSYMKENGALRTDYAPLEAEKKLLEEKLKAKDLTIEEMESKFKEIEENFRREKGHLESVVELKEIEIDDLRTKNYQIETFSDNLENQNKVLISQNEILEEKVLSLEEKIVPRANMSDYEAMKENLKSVDENIETFENHFKLPKTGNLVKLMQWVETKFSEMKSQIKSLFQENQDLKEEIEFLKMRNEKLIDEKADLLMELGANDSNFKEEDHLEKLVKNLENRPKVKLK